jgi:tetratricopeptide (TPR) repeat protein
LILISFSFIGIELKAQSAKDLYKSGIASQKAGNYKEAVKQFSAAINLKSDYTDAYFERANSNFNLNQFEQALPDYIYLHRLTPLNESYIIKASIT